MKKFYNNKTTIYFISYLIFVFSYPLFKGSIAHINGYSSYFKKLFECINIIPFNFDYTVMPVIIIKNIIFKISLFIPIGYLLFSLKKDVKAMFKTLLLIALLKELFHLLILYGYFDITDFIYYLIGGSIGAYIQYIKTTKAS